MKAVTLLGVSLSLVTTPAFAGSFAVPYDGLALYYGYNIDVLAHPGGGHSIAKGCKGSAAGGLCTFDEFFKHIFQVRKSVFPTSVGGNSNPDPLKVGREMISNGFEGALMPWKILPDKFQQPSAGVALPSYRRVMEEVTEVVQMARPKLNDGNNGLKYLDNMKTAWHYTLIWRRADAGSTMTSELNAILKAQGVVNEVIAQRITYDNLATWESPDFVTTINKSGLKYAGLADAVYRWTDNRKSQKAYLEQDNVRRNLLAALDAVNGDVTCKMT